MNCCGGSADWAGWPTTAMPAAGRTRVMPVHRCGNSRSPYSRASCCTQIGDRIVVECPPLLLQPLGRVAHQNVGGLPGVGFIFAADQLHAHAEADFAFATMLARQRPDLRTVLGVPLRQFAPDLMHVGILSAYVPRT